MGTSITPFNFPQTGQPVRTVVIGDEPHFVASDVCTVLGIANVGNVLARLSGDDIRSTDVTDAIGRRQATKVVTESGLYDLILDSRKPEARAFRRWITADVVPAIRRTGSYTVAPVTPALPDITTAAGVLAMAEQFARTARQLVEADDRIKEMEPKALAHDVLIAAQAGDVLVRQAAKALGWKERDLRSFLVDEQMLYRRQGTCGAPMWDFYAAHSAHFNATEQVVEHTWGSCAHYTVHVTPAGLALIQKRIERRKAELNTAITDSP